MYKYILHLIIAVSFASVSSSVHAQNDTFSLGGYIRDSFTDAGIQDAKVYFLSMDSVVQDSTLTFGGYSTGYFSFRVKRDKSLRSCIIKVSYPNYQTQYSVHSLTSVKKNARFQLPAIYIKRRNTFTERSLDEVEVTATKVKMFYRGDTLVYNADAFNVANGSMLDALIRQMPGTELHKNGEIFVNGRKVDNLLLNGKDFFRGKNKLMLENLPYYTVQEIKVYDKTTDKAMALHDDKAEKDFVMDVNLKKEYSKGYMANVEVGAGTEDAYLARLFGLRFTDVSRFAVVGGVNNLNMSDFSFSGSVHGSPPRDGRTDSQLLTAELLTEHKRNKNVLTVELNRKKAEHGADEFQETFHNDASTFSTARNAQTNRNIGASLTNKYTLKLPFWMESVTNLRFNHRKNESDERYYESGTDTRRQGLAVLDSLFSMGIALNDPAMISARKRWTRGKAKEYGASQNFNIAKNFRSTDIIDFSAGVDYAKSDNETDRFNRYLTWKTALNQNDIMEDLDRPNTHVGAKADVSYKISRLFYDTDLKFFAGYRFNRDKDRETITDAVSLAVDAENSYNRRMTENTFTAGMTYHYDNRHIQKKLRTEITINLPMSVIDRNTSYTRYTVDTCLTQSPVFFEPSLTVSHKKWKGDNIASTLWGIKVSTSLNYSLPEATQLITLPLTSDRMNIYQGNAHLKSPATWKSSLSWDFPMKHRSAYLQQSLTYTNYIHRIINTYRYDAGVYTNRPDNVNGTWNLAFTTRGQQFARILKRPITINYNLRSNYLRMKNFVAEGTAGKSQQIDNDELSNYAHVLFRSYYKKVSGGLRLSAEWRKPLNGRADRDVRDTWDYKSDLWLSAALFAGIDWDTECVLTKRQGYSNDELNKLSCDWSMGLSKSILKDKIDLKLQAIDILHQYKSVAYVVNERGIRETRSVSLPAYLLCSMTYKFNKQPKKRG